MLRLIKWRVPSRTSVSFVYILLRNADVLSARWFWVTVSFAMTIPLTFARSLTALKFTSSLSVSFVITLAVVCLLYMSGALEPCGGQPLQPQTCRYICGDVENNGRYTM